MRPKIVLVTLAWALVLVAGILLIKSGIQNKHAVSLVPDPAADERNSPASVVWQPRNTPPLQTPAAARFQDPEAEQEEEAVAKSIQEIQDAVRDKEPAGLALILSKINAPEKKVRTAAVEAVVAFDDRSAIPILRQIAGQISDVEDKAALEKAIEFLSLPSLTELQTQP